MKIKNVNLKWYALIWNNNTKKLERHNILHSYLVEDIHKKILRKKIKSRDELKEYMRSYLMYHYWSKCEYELYVGYHCSKMEELQKIDVWYQLEMNLDRIVDYIIKEMRIVFK